MSFSKRAALTAVGVLVLAGAGAARSQTQVATGPVADYWISAATTSGFGGMGGGAPSMASIMGGMGGVVVQHQLTLQLGSTLVPSGPPAADHLPPSSLEAGPGLPLVTPERYTPPPANPDPRPREMQRPQGRMLIYWGCGDTVGPGQPAVIDFAKISQGQFPNFSTIAVTPELPPSPDRYKSYGEWPNARSRAQVPSQGSLVGDHVVKGDYTPDIRFRLDLDQDFLAPLTITSQAQTPQGGRRLVWDPVPRSTGYFAWMLGSKGRDTVVFWSSSASQAFMGALMDYIPPGEARRLVASGAVLAPQTTTCTVPAEVVKSSPSGLLSMIAYGDELNLVDPPRPADKRKPWNISWRVKARFKSTTGALLGMENMRGADNDRPSRGQRPSQQPPERPGLGDLLRGGLPF